MKRSNKFIALECPGCDRKGRGYRDDYDPPEAVLLMVRCPDCSAGCKEDGGTYYDKDGNEVSCWKGETLTPPPENR